MLEVLLPEAISGGVSYSDYWHMTFGEILYFINYNRKKQEKQIECELQATAFNAYWGGYYSRPRVRMPETLPKAFPSLFGRTSDGQIKAENWQESKRALSQFAELFNANKKVVKK